MKKTTERYYTTPLSSQILSSFTTGRGEAVVSGVCGLCRQRVDNVAIKLVLLLVLHQARKLATSSVSFQNLDIKFKAT